MNNMLDSMNIELTTNCPLYCPQCYCTLTGGKNIDPETAIYWIKEGAEHGVKNVMLSGGETMCYPHIYDIIKAAHTYCGKAHVALSGYRFNEEVLNKMIDAGLDSIYVSLNGSTKEINALTRNGFELAIHALEVLKKSGFEDTTINWVMHSNNADDFINVVAIAEKYDIANLVILGVKPDSKDNFDTFPSLEQMQNVNNIRKSHKGKTKIFIESCFSPMLALACDTKLFGNLNVGKTMGCNAGRTHFSVSVDGLLSPCRHLEYYEKYDTLEDYWNNSEILKQLREIDEHKREPCNSCRFTNNCRHCVAVNAKLCDELFIGHPKCMLYTLP